MHLLEGKSLGLAAEINRTKTTEVHGCAIVSKKKNAAQLSSGI